MKLANVKALAFDVFGTVVDWRSAVIAEGRRWGRAKGWRVDWAEFAAAWRAGYAPAMQRVRSGELPWLKIDDLHRMILDGLLTRFQLEGLQEAEIDHFNRVWHRLRPWSDARRSLQQLRKQFIVATLSNGNMALLTNMAKTANLHWDCILSAELFQHYKPDREVYLGAAELLGLGPDQVMMVAAHNQDLIAASSAGLRTAFVARPHEYGPQQTSDLTSDPVADVVATDFIDLAAQLSE